MDDYDNNNNILASFQIKAGNLRRGEVRYAHLGGDFHLHVFIYRYRYVRVYVRLPSYCVGVTQQIIFYLVACACQL